MKRQLAPKIKFKRHRMTGRDTPDFAWQARGPGFESPMLHQKLNLDLALDRRECQVFGPLDHNYYRVDHNCDHLPGDHLLDPRSGVRSLAAIFGVVQPKIAVG
jgi:hypothetical protein